MAIFKLLAILFIMLVNIGSFCISNIQNITQYTFQYSPLLINKSEFITPGKTRRITHPGTYFLKEEVGFKSSGNDQDIISIETSNVVLILNDKAMFSDQVHTNTTGIRIKSGLSNIIIQRGSINQVNGKGIVIEDNCTNIAIRDTLVTNCRRGGIEISNCSDCILSNLYISQCNNNLTTADIYGLKLEAPRNINLENITIRSITNSHKNAYGIYISDGNSVNLTKCEAKLITGKTTYGFYQANSRASYLNSCTIENIKATEGNAYGRYYLNNKNITQVNSETTSIVSQSANAFGFFIDRSYQLYFNGCSAKDIDASFSTGNAFGFCIVDGEGSQLDNCTCNGSCGGTETTSTGAGLEVMGTERNCRIRNCTFSHNSGGNGTGYGLKLNKDIASCIVEGNKFLTNTGSADGYGVFDESLKSKNIYTNNFAYSNGKADKTTLNNFYVRPAPSGHLEDFPVKQIFHTSYLEFDNTHTRENIEVIEAQ